MKNYKSKWKEPSPSSLDGCLTTAGLISLETQVPSALCLGRDIPPRRGGGHRGSSSACPAPDGHAATTWEEQGHRVQGNLDTVLLPRCLGLLPLACPGLPTDVVRMVTLRGSVPKSHALWPRRWWSRAAPYRGAAPRGGHTGVTPPASQRAMPPAGPGPAQRGQ